MKTVNVALLALIISATSSPVVLAGDTIEAAATELSAINSGMSQSEIEQKITRFLERTDNSPAAYTYLTEHHYIPSETPDTTQTPPVQTDPDAGQKTVAATGVVQIPAKQKGFIEKSGAGGIYHCCGMVIVFLFLFVVFYIFSKFQ